MYGCDSIAAVTPVKLNFGNDGVRVKTSNLYVIIHPNLKVDNG